ncbi:low temperature requirement protein A [Agromyces archimandritae]|uniref:Low temperature requirement protein A n=2 Tax=Agromyces archimandritae TaxID=2781962 RepID=A0A975IQ99_9MICO|nr:low temperature requirement protein A [Agromyces archimandritae]
MTGRDPGEDHRAATPLELLFDLTFVVAFSQAGTQAARLLDEGRLVPAVIGFAVATFAICWAWINYSWLASAYDNDDLFFRAATFVEMVGVLVLALGMPEVFDSIAEGRHLNDAVLVSGYVVMRVATVALWVRAARDDPVHRRACIAYAVSVSIAQAGWIALIVVDPPLVAGLVFAALLMVVEMAGPIVAERLAGGTPWHPGHMAERYGLLVIITLGEVVLGTILAISAVVHEQQWSVEAGLVAAAGTALAFGMWWVYFTMPSAEVLRVHRERSFGWGYGHLVVFGSIAATGAGLHVAASVIEGTAEVGESFAVSAVVIPVAVFLTALFTLYTVLIRQFDPLHVVLFAGSLLLLGVSVAASAAGASMGWSLAIAALAPLVVIVGYETVGHRHQAAAMARALRRPD